MPGICAAVNATTVAAGSSRYTTLKLWKSRPAAPRITTRSVPATSGRLPGRDASDEIEHVHAAGLLQEARGRRRALSRPAVDDDRAVRDLREMLAEMLERNVHAPGDPLPPPL